MGQNRIWGGWGGQKISKKRRTSLMDDLLEKKALASNTPWNLGFQKFCTRLYSSIFGLIWLPKI